MRDARNGHILPHLFGDGRLLARNERIGNRPRCIRDFRTNQAGDILPQCRQFFCPHTRWMFADNFDIRQRISHRPNALKIKMPRNIITLWQGRLRQGEQPATQTDFLPCRQFRLRLAEVQADTLGQFQRLPVFFCNRVVDDEFHPLFRIHHLCQMPPQMRKRYRPFQHFRIHPPCLKLRGSKAQRYRRYCQHQ
jgi:hypothetical protein